MKLAALKNFSKNKVQFSTFTFFSQRLKEIRKEQNKIKKKEKTMLISHIFVFFKDSHFFAVEKKEMKYDCCSNKYTLLPITLYLRRKPLFYIINLIIPTSITTLIAIVGFFTHVFSSSFHTYF